MKQGINGNTDKMSVLNYTICLEIYVAKYANAVILY